ncbi:MAG: Asp-tRNA(Asn)/Glu-tRNA(Gln) amidotransferase subunit GatA [Bdellovibrionales bacterium]
MNFLKASVRDLRQGILDGDFSSKELTRFYLNRCRSVDKDLNSLISLNEDAESEAEEVDRKIADGFNGVLAGIPVIVKDLLCTKKLKTTAASKILSNYTSPYDSTVVKKLKEAGAIVLAKANMDEFAMGSSNETSFFGPVSNPWDKDRVPGGSSGGSAAAVAAGLAPLSIGTDTGGSIRQPASFCGVSGLKPTYGRVSRYGVIAFASSLDQVGPMGNYVDDIKIGMEAIAGFDPLDSTSIKQDSSSDFDADVKTIGIPKQYLEASLSDCVRERFQETVDELKARGFQLKEVDLKLFEYAVPTYYLIATSEASTNLSRYDGVRFGHRARGDLNLEDLYVRSRSEGFGDEVKRRIMLGTYSLSSGYYDAYYSKACKLRENISAEFNVIFKEVDCILSPVTTDVAFKKGEKIEEPLEMYLNDVFTISANLAGIPAISVPNSYSKEGLPIGIQIMAPSMREDILLRLGSVIEDYRKRDRRFAHVE